MRTNSSASRRASALNATIAAAAKEIIAPIESGPLSAARGVAFVMLLVLDVVLEAALDVVAGVRARRAGRGAGRRRGEAPAARRAVRGARLGGSLRGLLRVARLRLVLLGLHLDPLPSVSNRSGAREGGGARTAPLLSAIRLPHEGRSLLRVTRLCAAPRRSPPAPPERPPDALGPDRSRCVARRHAPLAAPTRSTLVPRGRDGSCRGPAAR